MSDEDSSQSEDSSNFEEDEEDEEEEEDCDEQSSAKIYKVALRPIEIMKQKDRMTVQIVNKNSKSVTPPISLKNSFSKPEEEAPVCFQRLSITGDKDSGSQVEDVSSISKNLVEALRIRYKYMSKLSQHFPETVEQFLKNNPPSLYEKSKIRLNKCEDDWDFHVPDSFEQNPFDCEIPKSAGYLLQCKDGVVHVMVRPGEIVLELKEQYVSKQAFMKDFKLLQELLSHGPTKTFAYRRLSYMQNKFKLHVLLNEFLEMSEQKKVAHRDFYNVQKVDTHVHAASSMNHKHLVRFMKAKMKKEMGTVVVSEKGKVLTLGQVFDNLKLKAEDLNVNMLDVHADRQTFNRFDKFNSKYNPLGQNVLRDIFLKTDNFVNGRYFAELLKEVITDLQESKYQNAEYRLSIYGRSPDEWDTLAKWAVANRMHSRSVRWMIQIPRLYDIYKAKNVCSNFQQLLQNIFLPLFEVTNDPSSHPELFKFLRFVVGIDSVDDESKPEHVPFDILHLQSDIWESPENPPYGHYLFYMYANLAVLNKFRKMRGFNTFALRPHCGEAGLLYHLVIGFMVAESISHGLMLKKAPVLQYLYYLCQIGIAMSPLSNNSLFVNYQRNPFSDFFAKGLNVSLSTDDPLQFHYTKEPLMEEYSIAAQVWKLNATDMCELSRNSVLQSGFPHEMKLYWLGKDYKKDGIPGNDIDRTSVSSVRIAYRQETLTYELQLIFTS